MLCSAANRGWTLADVCARIDDGRWAGLRGLYRRYRGGWHRALRRDWTKAAELGGHEVAGICLSFGH